MSLEKVTVIPAELLAVKAGVLQSLEKAKDATTAFFGGDSAIEGDAESVIQASSAHSMVIRAKTELEVAGSLKISSAEEYEAAADSLQRIKGIAKDLESKRKEMTGPIDESKKQIQALFNPATQFCSDAENAIKKAMIAFDNEQDRLRRIAEQKRREKEERERAALEAEQAAARAKAEADEKRLLEEAAAAAAAGDTVKAAKLEVKADAQKDIGEARSVLIEEKAATVSAYQAPEPVAVKGISKRKKYVATVTDINRLLSAIVAGTVPASVVKPDESALTKMANALAGQLNYPGVTITEETVIGARSK